MAQSNSPTPEQLIDLQEKFTGHNTPSNAQIKAQRVLNLVTQIRKLCDDIIGNSSDVQEINGLCLMKSKLNLKLTELSALFHESTPTEQKRFIESLMKRDEQRWEDGVIVAYSDSGEAIRKKYTDWDTFNKLKVSTPQRQGSTREIVNEVIDRERVLLEIYGVSLEDISRAFRR